MAIDRRYALLKHTHAEYALAATTLTAGAGLTGGGDLSADRTFDVGAGTGITVAADSVSLDTSYTDGRYVEEAGDTMTGVLKVNAGTNDFPIRALSDDSGAYVSMTDNATTSEAHVGVGAIGDELVLRANNAERVRVDSSGNVGIGTSSPGFALDIVGQARIVPGSSLALRISDSTSFYRAIAYETSGSRRWLVGADVTSETGSNVGSNFDFLSYDDTGAFLNNVLTLKRTGEAGIGTTDPDYALEVNGSIAAKDSGSFSEAFEIGLAIATSGARGLLLETTASGGSINAPFLSWVDGDANAYRMRMTGGDLVFGTGFFNERVRFDSAGNVGINNRSPTYLLDVHDGSTEAVVFRVNGVSRMETSNDAPLRITSTDSYCGLHLTDLNTTSEGYVSIAAVGDTLRLISGNAVALYADANQRIGIGTTSPASPLHIEGTTAQMRFTETGSGDEFVIGVTGSATNEFLIYDNIVGTAVARIGTNGTDIVSDLDVNNGGNITTLSVEGATSPRLDLINTTSQHWRIEGNVSGVSATSLGFYDVTGSAYRMVLEAGGNLGIGISNPSTRLDVDAGATSEIIRIRSTGNPYMSWYNSGVRDLYIQAATSVVSLWGETSKHMRFATNNTERMRITSAGRVGIGKTGPSSLLDVAGTITFSGGLDGNMGTNVATFTTSNNAPVRVESTDAVSYVYLLDNSTTSGNVAVGASGNSLLLRSGGSNITVATDLRITNVTDPTGAQDAATKNYVDTNAAGSSGTYTPTISATSNITSTTVNDARYLRVGNVVTVSGNLDINRTSSGFTSLEISLPVASNFTSRDQCAGFLGGEAAGSENQGGIVADVTNDTAEASFTAASGGSAAYVFHFTYEVL